MNKLALAVLALLLPWAPAHGQPKEIWTCSFLTSGENARAVIARYEVVGPVASEFLMGHKNWRVVENNEDLLVAIWIGSSLEPGLQVPAMGAVTIIIGKKDGAYLRFSAFFGADPVPRKTGTCLKG